MTAGVHIEQFDELHPDDSLLGLLRRGYTRRRGYNENCLTALRNIDTLEITSTTYDVVGGNPLHPASELHWRPA